MRRPCSSSRTGWSCRCSLSIAWLALFVIELVRGLTPFQETLGVIIWVIFIVDFLLKFALAPRKRSFLKGNWLTVIALLVPALRILRVFRALRVLRAARAVRGLRLLRFVTSLNRGMKTLGASLQRRGFGYVVAATTLVIVTGAAGMYALEKDVEGGIQGYGEALWWTAMLITSIGSDYWPQTPEGRLLCLLLSVYGLAVFGYITATLASYFVDQDAENDNAAVAGNRALRELQGEIGALREELRGLRERDER